MVWLCSGWFVETGLRTNIQCTKNKDDEPWQIATGGDYILHMFYPIRFVILFICIVNERKTIQEWLVSSKYSLCIATLHLPLIPRRMPPLCWLHVLTTFHKEWVRSSSGHFGRETPTVAAIYINNSDNQTTFSRILRRSNKRETFSNLNN